MPCGSKQWDVVTFHLLANGYSRTAEACRKKFDMLWSKNKPTGTPEIPRLILRAQIAKDKISSHEVIGHVNANDSDNENETSPIKGTNLSSNNGELRRPTPKKRKVSELSEAVTTLGEGNKEAASILADAMKEIASKLGKPSSDLVERVPKLEGMSAKLDMILMKLE